MDGNLSKGIRQLNGVYTQASNRRHSRSGHVFQGRFKAILVDKESYLLELSRYVVLNPFRAKGMVRRLDDWPWSSYRAMTGDPQPPQWLTVDWLLSQFGRNRRVAMQQYKEFVQAGINGPSIWDDVKGQIYLGDEAFVEDMQKRIGNEREDFNIPKRQTRPPAKPLERIVKDSPDRNTAIVTAYETGVYSQKDIALYFGLHPSTVGVIVRNRQIRDSRPDPRLVCSSSSTQQSWDARISQSAATQLCRKDTFFPPPLWIFQGRHVTLS